MFEKKLLPSSHTFIVDGGSVVCVYVRACACVCRFRDASASVAISAYVPLKASKTRRGSQKLARFTCTDLCTKQDTELHKNVTIRTQHQEAVYRPCL
jgi:hypothetical protein